MQKLIKDNGIYILELFVSKTLKINHRKFSNRNLSKGYYYYVGSAQKNLRKRIARHIKKEKNLHWHIDYLTASEDVFVKNCFVLPNFKKDEECNLVLQIEKNFSITYPLKGFGNSDCKNCFSHLLFTKSKITYNHFSALYQSIVRLIPSSKDIFCE